MQSNVRRVTVYQFRNGFDQQAQSTFGWLRHYGLGPTFKIAKKFPFGTRILIPSSEVACLRLMQANNPARFGNHPKGYEYAQRLLERYRKKNEPKKSRG